jgi:hypothetical protein
MTQRELAIQMLDFVRPIPDSANLGWVKDERFLFHFEAARMMEMRRALWESGINPTSEFDVLDFGYLHGIVPEFLHRHFPKAKFVVCDRPGSPIFSDPDYMARIRKRIYLQVRPLDIRLIGTMTGQKFRVIILGEIIEHMNPTEVTEILIGLRGCIADNGVLLITTPNAAGLYNCAADLFGFDRTVSIPVPDATMGYGHIHLWSAPVLKDTLKACGWSHHHSYFYHGRDGEQFESAWRGWWGLKYQIFIKANQILSSLIPKWRGFFVMTAMPMPISNQQHDDGSRPS